MTSRLLFLLVLIAASTAVAQPEEYPTPPEAVEHADVPKGRIDGPHEFRRQLFPEPSENTGSTFRQSTINQTALSDGGP
jgi:hypothetical protein